MIIDELFEGPQLCPECGGISFSDLILAEKKDACYYKVKASAKVWPSAYASGRLVQCRKKGAANYGKSKTESIRDPNEMSGVNSMRKKLGNIIKQAAQDDEVAYNASKLYRELWNIYGGDIDAIIAERSIFELEKLARELVAVSKQGVAEGKVKLYTDPSYFGAEVDDTGFDSLPVVNIPTNRLVGFEPDSKMQQPKAMANVKNILAGLEQGDNIPPILVRKYKNGYQVLDGHHRFWAYKVAKKDTIPARVVDPKDIEEVGKQGMAEQQELDEKWSQKYKKSINCANPRGFSQRAHCAGRKKNEDVAEGAGQPLSVQQLATISDAALDAAYGYGRSTPGNTFGWQANLKSAAYAKQMIDRGVTDIEAISDAIHKGWNTTAQAFVQNPDQFDDTAKLAAAGKLEAKLQQRAQLMKQNYAQLPEEEKEKDRVVARALLQAIRGEQPGMAESLGKQIHSTFQTMGDSFSDAHLAKGISYFLQGRHQEGENWLRGKIPPEAQAAVFGKLKTLQAQGGVDVNKNPRVQQYIDDKLVPWVKSQIQQNVKEGGDVFMPNIKDTPEYKAGLATGKLPVPHPEGTQQYASYYKGVIDRASPTLAKVGEEVEPTDDGAFSTWNGGMRVSGPTAYEKARQLDPDSFAEGEQQKGADYRDPKEVDYDDEYDAMVARVKKLAGLGPLKTVYDPKKRQYRNMPTAQQPKK